MKGARRGAGGEEEVKVGWEGKRQDMMEKVKMKGGERKVETRKKRGNKWEERERKRSCRDAQTEEVYWRRKIKRRKRRVRGAAEKKKRGEGEREEEERES